MLWPLLGGLLLAFFGFALFAGGWMATRNCGDYQGVMVWGGLALLFAASLIDGGIIRWLATEVGVSNRRVLVKTGFFSRRCIEVLLLKVESVGVNELPFGRILGYGTVIVRGTGGTCERFGQIAHPGELRQQVRQQVERSISA